jgi:hypothetical protein
LEAVTALKEVHPFIGKDQRAALADLFRGEEQQFFFDKICELRDLVKTMPKTYEQDGAGADAVVYLHYFTSGADWHITEKDTEPEQNQAFGRADLYGDGGELGYVSIVELLAAGAELDFYFTPKTLKQIDDEISRRLAEYATPAEPGKATP